MTGLFSVGLETFNKTLPEAQAGDQVGCLLKGVKKDDVRRGIVVCKPGTVRQVDQVMAQVYMLSKEEGGDDQPIVPYQNLHLYSRVSDITVNIRMQDREMILPGEDGT